jgi:hypothetical protein
VTATLILVAHCVNERESDMRNIKEGWYAVRRDGVIGFGPFATQAECLLKIARAHHGQ